jgi:catechol 2,3-dioxygenase-like lactoylglutathione lyase family enzyme
MKLIYFGIRVKNMNDSISFYTKGLGMKLAQKPQTFPPTGGLFAYLKSKNSPQMIELNWYPDSYVEDYNAGDELDHLGFWLNQDDDMEEIVNRLVKLGGRVAISPYVEGRTRLAFVVDINGIWIEFLQRVKKRDRKADAKS